MRIYLSLDRFTQFSPSFTHYDQNDNPAENKGGADDEKTGEGENSCS